MAMQYFMFFGVLWMTLCFHIMNIFIHQEKSGNNKGKGKKERKT